MLWCAVAGLYGATATARARELAQESAPLADIVSGKENGVPPLLGIAALVPADDKPLLSSQTAPSALQRQVQVQNARIKELSVTIVSLNEKLAHLQSRASQELAADTLGKEAVQLRHALAENQRQYAVATQDLEQLRQTYTASVKENKTSLKQKNSELQTQAKALTDAAAELAKVKTEVRPARLKPDGKKAVRDYAIGVSLAKDVLSLLDERESEGVKVDRSMALNGIQDAFANTYQVSQADRDSALSASAREIQQRQNRRLAETEKEGGAYRAEFAQQKGVKTHPDGFLYLVDYAGDDPIADTDIVSVSVKESLIGGEVINDMSAGGTFVEQPLNAYSHVFQQAIRMLKSHGSITLVVPPSLAYGDKGYPPDIPPGATMVYNLRIQDVRKP